MTEKVPFEVQYAEEIDRVASALAEQNNYDPDDYDPDEWAEIRDQYRRQAMLTVRDVVFGL